MNRRAAAAALFAPVALVTVLWAAPLAAASEAQPAPAAEAAPAAGFLAPAQARALLERVAPALVSVEVVVKVELQMGGQGRDQESSIDALGVVVDPGGLILLSNLQISASRINDLLRATGAAPGVDFKMTPTRFEVKLDGDDRGRPALLAAVDSQLDLAFLQLEEPPAEPLPAIDFSAAVDPEVGDEVVAVSRLNESFDHAPYFETYRVSGAVKRPRRAWVLDGEVSAIGLPVFTPAGEPVGVVSTVLSSVTADGGGFGPGGLLGGLDRRKTLGPVGIFLLPARPVARAIELSRQRADELLAERRERVAAGEAAPDPEPAAVEGEPEVPTPPATRP